MKKDFSNYEFSEIDPEHLQFDGFLYPDNDVYIPAFFNGKKVVRVKENAFEDIRRLHSVYIEEGIESIGNGAFYVCTSLKEVTLPTTLKSLGPNYDQIPKETKGVKANYRGIFEQCIELERIIIPENVNYIALLTFSDCAKLEYIEMPNSVCDIGNGVFSRCTNLFSVILSNSLNKISVNMFCNCTNLRKIIIPNSVIKIERMAFSHCTELREVILPNSLIAIEDNAFEFCKNLKTINFPSSLKYLGNHVFRKCSMTLEKEFEDFKRRLEQEQE